MKKVTSLLLLLLAITSGCSTVRSMLPSTEANPGDQMISQAAETKKLGKKWNEGQRMIEKGNKLLSKSQELALESQDAKAEAEGLIAQGKALVENSENRYEMAFGESDEATR